MDGCATVTDGFLVSLECRGLDAARVAKLDEHRGCESERALPSQRPQHIILRAKDQNSIEI